MRTYDAEARFHATGNPRPAEKAGFDISLGRYE